MTLSGKTVLITGASRGIGAATAQHLASLDANVVLIARSNDALKELAREIGPYILRKVDKKKIPLMIYLLRSIIHNKKLNLLRK